MPVAMVIEFSQPLPAIAIAIIHVAAELDSGRLCSTVKMLTRYWSLMIYFVVAFTVYFIRIFIILFFVLDLNLVKYGAGKTIVASQ